MKNISKDEFLDYFKKYDVGDLSINVLRQHYLAPGRAATASELAKAVGYKKYTAVNLTYGLLAKKIINYWYQMNIWSENELLASLIKNGVLRDGSGEVDPKLSIFMKRMTLKSNWTFYMSDELAEAVEEMGWVKSKDRSLISGDQEDPTDPTSFEEGGIKYRTVQQYERSTKARRECINKNGDSCIACGISFRQLFGEEFDGLIVVHHTKPLAVKEIRKTDPVNDMKPLCPNCHAMAHYGLPGDKPRSIEELRKIIRK